MKIKKAKLISVKLENSKFEQKKIGCSADGYEVAKQFYNEDIDIYESFFIIMLNRANKTIAYANISTGGLFATIVDPVVVAKYAIDCLALNVILVHNHPTGDSNPSKADEDLTKRIKNCLELFSIKVLDHLILTENSYYSFADEGIL